MFTKDDLKHIDPSYFFILQAGCYSVTLQSKNTKHYWHILSQEGSGFSTCQINHKHHYEDSYHLHRNQPTLTATLAAIYSHDEFHIKRQKSKHSH